MAERVALDPTEVATGRTEFDISDWVSSDGIDWGDSAIEQYLAEANRGQVPVDFRVPNRTISIPLKLTARGTVTFEQARSKFQQKAGRIQQEGGWLRRITNGGGTVFCDLTNATLKLGGGWEQAHKSYDTDASLVLEAIPDFYGAEIDLGDNTETTLPELIFTDTNVQGDYPARVRLVVDEDDGDTQLGLIWGFRSRHYSSASTAALAYQAEALQRLDSATLVTSASSPEASGGTVVRHGTLSTNWTPVMGTNIGGTAYMTHTGSYRVWGRVWSNSGTAVQTRFVWDVGDLTSPTENSPYTLHQTTYFEWADLGEVRLSQVPSGSVHRWLGQVQAKGDVGVEQVYVDRIAFQPLDEGAGRLTAPLWVPNQGISTFSARDEFNQSAGTLTAKTAAVGGVWVGAGDADDFSVETTGKTVQRTAVSDSAFETGRYAISGAAAMTNMAVQVDFKATATTTFQGVVLRYVDVNNWAIAGVENGVRLSLYMRVGGGTAQIAGWTDVGSLSVDVWRTVRASVDASGQYAVWLFAQGSEPGDPILIGNQDVLSSSFSLDDGKPGFYDHQFNATASTRNYDNFAAWVPSLDAVMFPNQSVELRTEGMYREDIGGTAYGPVPQIVGDLPRLPVSGMEGRTVQTFLKASRGDFDGLPDSGLDNISARPFYRPSWLFVPGS